MVAYELTANGRQHRLSVVQESERTSMALIHENEIKGRYLRFFPQDRAQAMAQGFFQTMTRFYGGG